MKKILVILVLAFSTLSAFAQSESVKPTFGVTIEREVSFATIDNKDYSNITVEIKAAELGDAFSDGTIQVGKGNALTQLSLYKSNGRWLMNLKEKGIY